MKYRLAFAFAVLSLCVASLAGSQAAMLVGGGSTASPPSQTLAKAGEAPDFYACKAQCRKAYRRCYSEGNQVGKPYETGGQPCSEQRATCIRACRQQQK